MPSFTKGKWKYLEQIQQVTAYPDGEGDWTLVNGSLPAFSIEDGHPVFMKDITGELTWNGLEETEANGRLIAAAPDMYNLLQAMVTRTCNNCRDFKQQARELLKSIDAEE